MKLKNFYFISLSYLLKCYLFFNYINKLNIMEDKSIREKEDLLKY